MLWDRLGMSNLNYSDYDSYANNDSQKKKLYQQYN